MWQLRHNSMVDVNLCPKLALSRARPKIFLNANILDIFKTHSFMGSCPKFCLPFGTLSSLSGKSWLQRWIRVRKFVNLLSYFISVYISIIIMLLLYIQARYTCSVASRRVASTQQPLGDCCVLHSALRASLSAKVLKIFLYYHDDVLIW